MMAHSARWLDTQRLTVNSSTLGQREFHPRTHHREADIVAAFGCSNPSSENVLLHSWKEPDAASGPPVILVHGANRNAAYFLDPHEDGSGRDPLPEAIRKAGRQVYAVSFAHNQDDNWWWCEALNEAILRVSQRHGDCRVALVGHSKGGLAVRLAATDWRPSANRIRFLGPLIERIVLLGAPNGGVDFFHRYPSVNLAFSGPGDEAILNWPTSWHQRKVDGQWLDLPIWYLARPNLYPGQAQLLARWREEYPLPGLDPNEEMTYEGGESDSGRCRGIDQAIAASGDMIGELRRRATPPDIPVALLAAASPTMPGVLNDTCGPSDGIVYVKSALEYPEPATLVALEALPVHHKALIAQPLAQAAIVAALEASEPLTDEGKQTRRLQAIALGERLRLEARTPVAKAWMANS